MSTSTEPFLDLSLPIPRMRRGREASSAAEPTAADAATGAAAAAAAGDDDDDHADAAHADAHAAHADAADAAGGGPASAREAAAASSAAASASSSSSAAAASRGGAKARVLAQLPQALREPPARLGLAACLQALLAPETLEGENAYSCDKCAARAHATAEAKAAAKVNTIF